MFKKLFIIVFFCILTQNINSQSDSTRISNSEIRTTCLIFAEHQKLSNENPLLKQQIASLEELNQLYVKSDSIQKIEINTYKDKVASDEKKIQRLKSAQKKTIIGSSVGGIVLFILGLLL